MASQTRMISFEWEDSEGNTKSFPLYFDSADITTIAAADVVAGIYAELMAAVSGCVITNASIQWDLTVPAPGSPDGGYFLNSGAYLSFEDSNEVGSGFYIPGILNANVVGKVVNPETAGMTALIEAVLGTSSEEGNEPLSTRGSGAHFAEYVRGYLTQRQI